MGSAGEHDGNARSKVIGLFNEALKAGRPLYVSAPMVRYSKLPFRLLVRDYGADIIYTPMMLAHEFIRSQYARDSDFTTSLEERQPTSDGRQHALVAQFASSDPDEFARAAELIAPWVDGVDLNCGCPQGWAIKEGIGCSLMTSPDLVASMIKAAKLRLDMSKSVSCKIRISKDLKETQHWIRTVEDAGIDYITIHGRTRSQRSSTPPNYDAIRQLRAQARVPLIANGDVYNSDDALEIAAITGVAGVMAARGILENPSLFADHTTVSVDCVRSFVAHAVIHPIPYQLVLHHVSQMADNMKVSKKFKKKLMDCPDIVDLIDFVEAWSPNHTNISEAGVS